MGIMSHCVFLLSQDRMSMHIIYYNGKIIKMLKVSMKMPVFPLTYIEEA